MKKLVIMFAAFSVSIVLTAAAAAVPTGPAKTSADAAKSGTITIRHQMRGCHTWSANGRTYRASISMRLARGGTIRFVDNDVMPHKLIKKSGPAVQFRGNRAMNHMGASVKATFAKAGTYKFVTRFGEDYPGVHLKTIGDDNVLRLTVKVV
ncbi:MAG: hypothetical protein M3R70_03240 [Actinomycetota bacterium]|nr:hypothetical protein [Actinomycetota bacterium]